MASLGSTTAGVGAPEPELNDTEATGDLGMDVPEVQTQLRCGPCVVQTQMCVGHAGFEYVFSVDAPHGSKWPVAHSQLLLLLQLCRIFHEHLD